MRASLFVGSAATAAALAAVAMLASCGSQPSASAGPTGDDAAEGGGRDATVDGADAASDSPADAAADACHAPADAVKAIYDGLDATKLQTRLREMCGASPVTIDDNQFSISERYSPAGKALYRFYWLKAMTDLGISAQTLPYPTAHAIGETDGHDMEAVLPGKSPDSIVVIIHYDSMGPGGAETTNPACDDDMSGMAAMLEAARLLSDPCVTREKTIRFVATDYEEQLGPGLEGARWYAQWLTTKAKQEGFKVVAAIDYEQSGFNCASTGACDADAGGVVFDVNSCSDDGNAFDSGVLGDGLQQLVGTLQSPLVVSRGCMAQNSDHYAMGAVGVPAVVTCEHDWMNNPHFDRNGGDTYDKIDTAYHEKISRVVVAFTAKLAGVGP